MFNVPLRRPSPAFVVAVFALLVALGGTGYAAVSLPRGSVGTEQLQPGAVTTNKLHANAVSGAKVKPDTLRGSDIRESSLDQVPSAHLADLATSADSAQSAQSADNADALEGHGAADFVPSATYKEVLVKLQDGDEQEIVRNGPVSIYASCHTVGANDELRMYAVTEADGAVMVTSWGDILNGSSPTRFLDISTSLGERQWDDSASGPPSENWSAVAPTGDTKLVMHNGDNHLIAPSGEAINWPGESEILALNYLGARCLIAGTVRLYDLG